MNENISPELVNLIDRDLSLHPRIQALRQQGRDAFIRLGLPENKSEEYKHTPITRLLLKNLKLDKQESQVSDLKPEEIGIAGVDAQVIVFVNGIFSPEYSKIGGSAGLVVMPLAEALNNDDGVALDHLGNYADHEHDGLAAWNTASWTNGTYIRVSDNVVVDKPIILHYIHDARQREVISVQRNLFVVGTNSQVTVIEKYTSAGGKNHFSNHVTEAVVKASGSFNLYTLQHDSGNRYQYSLTKIHQANSSRVNTFTFTLSGKLVRNNLYLSLDGEGIESHMFGLYLLSGDTLGDNHTVVDHRKPNSFSNEIYKGIMDGNSKGVFNGKIYVRPQAQKTNAFQANRNILLSDKATVNTKPQLEIWADDVKCSHGCTTGQLDEEAMFYLQTRGIDKETARALMLYAFASEILNNVNHPELKSYFEQLVSERLHKNF